MSTAETGISWTDRTWNPVRGCSRVSEGCEHCYAEGIAGRFTGLNKKGEPLPFMGFAKRVHGRGHWTGKVALIEDDLILPLRWRKPATVFVNSMSDLFHEGLSVADIARVFNIMASATATCTGHAGPHVDQCWQGPPHTFIALTKRPARALQVIQELPAYAAEYFPNESALSLACEAGEWPLRNVWIGASIEHQAAADERAPDLLRLAALGWKTWVSYEPALGPVDWAPLFAVSDHHGEPSGPRQHAPAAVVCGGESGRGARPMHPDWARAARDACYEAGVPFHFKQWGEWAPWWPQPGREANAMRKGEMWPTNSTHKQTRHVVLQGTQMRRVGKKAAGRTLDGRTHDDLPWPIRPKRTKGAA